jgi:hypothetical protein
VDHTAGQRVPLHLLLLHGVESQLDSVDGFLDNRADEGWVRSPHDLDQALDFFD